MRVCSYRLQRKTPVTFEPHIHDTALIDKIVWDDNYYHLKLLLREEEFPQLREGKEQLLVGIF